ncbi:MAG: efflux RND transporter periplasmic adaptor subunit [Hyphomicrobiales bacterium]
MHKNPIALSVLALPLIASVFSTQPALAGEYEVALTPLTESKAVYGQVQSPDVVPARARLGGTVISLAVDEGTAVQAGDVLATIVDDKLALQMKASDADIESITAQLDNARTELARVKKLVGSGVAAKATLDQAQTQVDVLSGRIKAAEASRAVLEQQAKEGKVLAPASGRVIGVPVTQGSVVMPGEPLAQLATGQAFLRLNLPERHAGQLKEGTSVDVAAGGLANSLDHPVAGKLVKIYPAIQDGKVIADVAVDGLDSYFTGERVLVRIPVAERQVVAVPVSAVSMRFGIDYVRVAGAEPVDAAVITGERFASPSGELVEVLSGLSAGDKVVTP